MADDSGFSRFVPPSAPPDGSTVLAVSAGDGWLLEVRAPAGEREYLIVAGGDLDLFGPRMDEALAALGVRRCGRWTSSPVTFGFTTVVEHAR